MISDDKYVEIVPSIPSLKDRIHVNIKDPNDKIFWYIKFNLALDPESVSKKTTNVTDTEGYILDISIRYDEIRNLIEISPLEDYVQNHYYLLNISKKVRSVGKKNLKRDIHILFKLKGRVVTEFKILPPNVKVPKPKKRPRQRPKVFQEDKTASRVYSFEKDIDNIRGDSLPTADIMVNPLIGAIGLIMTLVSLLQGNFIAIVVCAVVAGIGVIHIIIQFMSPVFRSNFVYNMGVRAFKHDKFNNAAKLFDKALKINPQNEYAEYAKNKTTYYIS